MFMNRPPAAAAGRTRFVLWLDAILLLLYLLEQAPRSTGLLTHEVLGMAIAVPIVLHLLLSWRWITSNARRLFVQGNGRTRLNYVINVVVFTVMFTVIFSGVVISRVALPAIGIATIFDRGWFNLHDVASNVLFAAVALHLAMNWGWVLAMLRRRAFSPEEAAVNTPAIAEAAGE
jgi:hypothetical protein